MKRQLLGVMVHAFADWLRPQMDPGDKATLHTLTARAQVVLDAVPPGQADAPGVSGLDPPSVEAGLGWLFRAVALAYPGDAFAPFSCAQSKLLVKRNAPAIAALAQPPEAARP